MDNTTNRFSCEIGKRLLGLRGSDSKQSFVDRFNKKYEKEIENGTIKHLVYETYDKWEKGQNPLNMDYLPYLCSFCNCDYMYFFDTKRIAKENYVQEICDYTGLTEHVIEFLHDIISNNIEIDDFSCKTFYNFLEEFILDEHFSYVEIITLICSIIKGKKVIHNVKNNKINELQDVSEILTDTIDGQLFKIQNKFYSMVEKYIEKFEINDK